MPIDFECPTCWRVLTFEDAQAGNRVKCRHCLAEFTLPGAEAATYGLAAEMRCPSCRKEVAKGAVLCIECGYDFRTAKKRFREVEEKEVVQKAGGSRFHFRRDRKGRWSLAIEGRLLGLKTGAREYDLRRYSAVVGAYQHDGWDDNEGEVTLYLEAPDGRRERIYFGENWDLVNWLEGMFRDEVGLKFRTERA